MTGPVAYCDGPECDRPVAGHGQGKCETHLKQLQRSGKCTPIKEHLTAEERAIEAGSAMLDSETDEEYRTLRRAYLRACRALGAEERQKDRRREPETPPLRGRPPKVLLVDVERLMKRHEKKAGRVEIVARLLKVHRMTVYRCSKKLGIM